MRIYLMFSLLVFVDDFSRSARVCVLMHGILTMLIISRKIQRVLIIKTLLRTTTQTVRPVGSVQIVS